MKKVCIITIYDTNHNYGNSLQNYALQERIQKMGYKVVTIRHLSNKRFSLSSCHKFIQFLKDIINFILKRNYRWHRKQIYHDFNKRYLKYSRGIIYATKEKRILKQNAVKYVIGSDQIWNYSFFNEYFGRIEFCLDVPKEKCFSYAASFGVSEVPESLYELYDRGLNHLNKISVRENSGINLVKQLSGREDATLVLDPSFLLSVKDWEKIVKKPNFINDSEKYVLLYFLGDINDLSNIEQFARENNYKTIVLKKGTYEFCYTGPCEFLYLIQRAELILTDSFHACAFSLIFDKRFFVYERKQRNICSMTTRIDSLLTRLNLQNKKIKTISGCNIEDSTISKEAKDVLDNDIKNSLSFLDKSISTND